MSRLVARASSATLESPALARVLVLGWPAWKSLVSLGTRVASVSSRPSRFVDDSEEKWGRLDEGERALEVVEELCAEAFAQRFIVTSGGKHIGGGVASEPGFKSSQRGGRC
jgi:hypothetical protein